MKTLIFTKAFGLAAPLCLALAAPALSETTVVLRTSDNVGGAGTDSNVYVKFFGPEGSSKRYRLQNKLDGDILEAGDYDMFTISDEIGAGVTRIELESDGRYPGSDWHLAEIKTFTSDMPGMTGVASTLYVGGAKQSANIKEQVVTSTFSYDNWITGDEEMAGTSAGIVKKGIELQREEPLATLKGPGKSAATKIFMVMWADGMDGAQSVPVSLSHTFTRSDSMKLTTGTTNAIKTGAEIGVRWGQGQHGKGVSVEGKLSAEYAWAKSKVSDHTWSTTSATTADDKFAATAGTFEFRILESTGTVTTKPYKSMMGNGSFSVSYLDTAANFYPRGVTFTRDRVEDAKWNQSVAKPLALSQGEAEYNAKVARLKTFGALSKPISYAEALKR